MNDRLLVMNSALFFKHQIAMTVKQFSIKSYIYSGSNALQILNQYAGQRIGIVSDSFYGLIETD
jgi:hypothetical protein